NYRFRERPGIGALAAALRAGDGPGALEVLDNPAYLEVARRDPPSVSNRILDPLTAALEGYYRCTEPADALAFLETFRILSATRRGRWGAQRLNALVESRLESMGRWDGATGFYPGRPILIESNDYQIQLFNGDLGVCWPEGAQTWAFFPDPAQAGALRRIPLAKLPPHATAWAMTVHKSQGSELDHVLLVLGDRDPGDLLSRELVYTGVTRARQRVDVAATRELIYEAAARSSRRTTGLTEALARSE
ncbi:MAG: ATP-binding domain-containing protein, partial [Acidobacteriota bacterium]